MVKWMAGEIRPLRERLGLTQRDFAALLGVCEDSVSNWETGRSNPQRLTWPVLEELRARTVKAPPVSRMPVPPSHRAARGGIQELLSRA